MKGRAISRFLLLVIFLTIGAGKAASQSSDTTFYLITCGPGTETYSLYGHSALRIVTGTDDIVFNWGVFDFDTPNFAWKFAKGRLNYMVAYEPYNNFLRSYLYEQRVVFIQQINLESQEKSKMLELIRENIKPENKEYRYDFFYDDCSTRIRDLIERSVLTSLIYPSEVGTVPTFRQMINKYQQPFPWLSFGIDLLLGMPSDKKADVRERMFLPLEMMDGLSATTIYRNGENVPLLGKAEIVLDFPPPVTEGKFPGPFLIFSVLFFIILLLSLFIKKQSYINILDFLLFFVFSLVAILLVFFNFFSDHNQVKWNFNIIWISPVIILCLFSILLNRKDILLFRLLFFITAVFIALSLFIPQQFNVSAYPLMLILLMRSSARSGFEWNPLSTDKE
ncbi:MAG TPA: DUF4105 domain-containing protein [Bacteroidales bacterium]|nr:DUF4105 domain-containing protein [Bacteroidales bacterium]